MTMVNSEQSGHAAAPSEVRSAGGTKNWLLLLVRNWHGLLGVAAGVFILFVCVSGIYLNHKAFYNQFLMAGAGDSKKSMAGGEGKMDKEGKKGERKGGKEKEGVVLTVAGQGKLPIGFDQALAIASEKVGEARLDRIELREEYGRVSYKVRTHKSAGPQREVIIDAMTGETKVKEEGAGMTGEAGGSVYAHKAGFLGYDWGKLIKDLHTGEFGGEAGQLFVDFVSGVVMVLTLSGLYLWVVPKIRKARSARKTEERARAVGAASV